MLPAGNLLLKGAHVKMLWFFLDNNCMLLIYFQGLGLIANDTTASAADTGAFTNCLDDTLPQFSLIPAPFPLLVS